MLFHLMPLLSDYIPATRVFQQTTFRTAWGIVTLPLHTWFFQVYLMDASAQNEPNHS